MFGCLQQYSREANGKILYKSLTCVIPHEPLLKRPRHSGCGHCEEQSLFGVAVRHSMSIACLDAVIRMIQLNQMQCLLMAGVDIPQVPEFLTAAKFSARRINSAAEKRFKDIVSSFLCNHCYCCRYHACDLFAGVPTPLLNIRTSD